MKKAILISVKKPCSENFENFNTTAQGGFCSNCKKEVIDFTTMPEKKLISYLLKNQEATCGRFKKSQLKTYTNVPHTRTTNVLSKSIGIMSFSLLSLCALTSVRAQDVSSANTTTQTALSSTYNQETTSALVNQEYTVKGSVFDEDSNPLPGVNVILKGTTEGTVTDLDGKFEFPRPLQTNDVLVFSYLGYESKEHTITENASENIAITITFEAADVMLMGAVVVDGVHHSKRTIFQKIASLFK